MIAAVSCKLSSTGFQNMMPALSQLLPLFCRTSVMGLHTSMFTSVRCPAVQCRLLQALDDSIQQSAECLQHTTPENGLPFALQL